MRGASWLALLLAGLGIGWLAGLSVSPVISVVITSVVGATAAVVGALGGASNEKGQTTTSSFAVKVSAWPLVWLVAGLVIGSSLGVIARTHNFLLLGQNPSLRIWSNYGLVPNENAAIKRGLENAINAEIDFWEGLGLEKTQVAQRFFELRYPVAGPSNQLETEAGGDPGTPGLFFTTTLSRTECETLQNQSSTGDLRFEMERQGGKLRMLSEALTVDEAELETLMDAKLEEVVSLLCTPEP